jgi:hypothetical protein
VKLQNKYAVSICPFQCCRDTYNMTMAIIVYIIRNTRSILHIKHTQVLTDTEMGATDLWTTDRENLENILTIWLRERTEGQMNFFQLQFVMWVIDQQQLKQIEILSASYRYTVCNYIDCGLWAAEALSTVDRGGWVNQKFRIREFRIFFDFKLKNVYFSLKIHLPISLCDFIESTNSIYV